jgi:uncharacterized membrane protein
MGDKMGMTIAILVVSAAVMGGVAQILLKKGMSKVGKITLIEMAKQFAKIILTNPYIFAGLAIYVISTVVYLAALSSGEVSAVYPIISVSYVITGILAIWFLNEKISLTRNSGFCNRKKIFFWKWHMNLV